MLVMHSPWATFRGFLEITINLFDIDHSQTLRVIILKNVDAESRAPRMHCLLLGPDPHNPDIDPGPSSVTY